MSEGVPIQLPSGLEVRLEDADGNSCLGVIQQPAGHGYTVIPIWSTWLSAVNVTGANGVTTTTRDAILA